MVEEEIFRFLRNSFQLGPKELKPEFSKLLERLKTYEKNRFETRAFVYLDIISWLESKIREVPVQDIIQEKFLSGINPRSAATAGTNHPVEITEKSDEKKLSTPGFCS